MVEEHRVVQVQLHDLDAGPLAEGGRFDRDKPAYGAFNFKTPSGRLDFTCQNLASLYLRTGRFNEAIEQCAKGLLTDENLTTTFGLPLTLP